MLLRTSSMTSSLLRTRSNGSNASANRGASPFILRRRRVAGQSRGAGAGAKRASVPFCREWQERRDG